MKKAACLTACAFIFTLAESAHSTPEYIANFSSFSIYPYNITAYKQNDAFVGCGPTTGAMIFGYFQAVYSLTDLLTNPGTGVYEGLNTAWALHSASYMKTQTNGLGSQYEIKPGMEKYAQDKGYTLKVLMHVSPANTDPNDPAWGAYGVFGDAWTNDAAFYMKNPDNTWKIDAEKFCDFLALKLPLGIPIFLTIDSNGNGDGDHWVVLVGYDRPTKKYAFFDTYSTAMRWADIYYVADPAGQKVNSIAAVRTVTLSLPDIAADRTSYHYGYAVINRDMQWKGFFISNAGTGNLRVTATTLTGANASAFSILEGGGAFDLTPGATHKVEIQFAPTTLGDKNASLSLACNDPDENPFLIALGGTGIPADQPRITVDPSSWNYGSISQGSHSDKTFVLSNAGTATLNVTAVTLEGAAPTLFGIQSGGGAFSLAPGAVRNVVVRFAPVHAGNVNACLNCSSNDLFNSPLQINLSGTGISGNVPDIAADPPSWNYGSVALGSYSDKTFVLSNTGTAALNVTSTYMSYHPGSYWAEFRVMGGGSAFSLAPGATSNFIIRFMPGAVGARGAFLQFNSDDPDENLFQISLNGTGTPGTAPDIASDPPTWNFGAVHLGSYSDKTFTISNSGLAQLYVPTTTLTGVNRTQFSIQHFGGAYSLAPGSTYDITVRFSPTGTGAKTASLSLVCNDPDENPFLISLSGTGTAGTQANPPSTLTALSGYDHAVPLAWKAPSDIPAENPVLGYNVNRKEGSGSPIRVASNVPVTCYRDGTAENEHTYTYTVTALYGSGESGNSNEADGQAKENGYVMASRWTSANPVMDGVIQSNEWSDAVAVNMAPVGSAAPVTLYLMNNATRLFMAVDDRLNTNLNHGDQFYAFVDKDHNREWAIASGSEGNFGIYWDGGGGTAIILSRWIRGTWPDALSLGDYATPLGVSAGFAAVPGNVQFETSMELGSTLLQASPGVTLGMVIGIYDTGTGTFTGYWPQATGDLSAVNSELPKWGKYPFAFGDLRLASPTAVQDQTKITHRFALEQNYPNPFNPATTICYFLPSPSEICLIAFDISGREVAVLAKGKRPAGEHRIIFDGKSMNSGMYFCKLEVDSRIITRKMLLLK